MDEEQYKVHKSLASEGKAQGARSRDYHFSMRLLSTDRLFRIISKKREENFRSTLGRIRGYA